jgi:acetyl-CoA acetyltransferase
MSARRRAGYEDIVLVAPLSVPTVRHSEHLPHWFFARAFAGMLARAGLGKDDVDGFCIASMGLAPDSVVGLTQHLGLSPRWIDQAMTAGCSGITLLRRAARAVQCGDVDIAACIAADTHMPDSFRDVVANFSLFARDGVYPYGAGGPNQSFAFLTDHYMRSYGATREDFGSLCVMQRRNGMEFPQALLRKPLTLPEYLQARPIADPLVLFDCVMPCAGAEGFLVMTRERAEDLGLPYAKLLATIERTNAFPADPVQFRGGWAQDRDALYAQAALGPEDIDFLQTYDDYPVISMMQFEDLGFCAKGEGPEFVRRHDLTNGGDFPVNTSGGQLSVGQAGAAGGFLGLVEAIRQLNGETLGGRVSNPRHGLVCGFGIINYDRGLCSGAAILGRRDT